MDAFLITLQTPTGETRRFFRDGDKPKIAVVDPMQGHFELLAKYTDDDLHNVTAYLNTLK
jgi:cytochrome c oxidase cbb3-type subunit 3